MLRRHARALTLSAALVFATPIAASAQTTPISPGPISAGPVSPGTEVVDPS